MSDQNRSCSPGETMVFSYLSRTLQSSDQLLTVCACHWRLYHETAPLSITNIVFLTQANGSFKPLCPFKLTMSYVYVNYPEPYSQDELL